MKTLQKYQCDICDQVYDSQADALACEATPLKDDYELNIGDKVRILRGDCTGGTATIEAINAHKRSYYNERLHHSIYLVAKVDNSWGHRQLSVGDYEPVQVHSD